MIRTIFVPESIDSYYLFEKRIVACEITKSQVKIAVTKMHKNKKSIESVIEKNIESDASISYHDRASETLVSLLKQVGPYDELRAILPAGIVIFKEITVPFVNQNKIKLIVPFEVEPLLPFSLNEATIDFIVTQQDAHSSTALVAAVKNDLLADHLDFFKKAGVDPLKVTVDLFELYSLYKALFAENKSNTVLFYMDFYSTRLAFVLNGQLKAVRFLPQGIAKLAKMIMREPENLIRVGLEKEDHTADSQMEPFFTDIKITVNAISEKLQPGSTFEQITIMGSAVDIKSFDTIVERIIKIPCKTITTHILLQHGIATFQENHGLPNGSIIPISAALSFPTTRNFNLYATHAREKVMSLLSKQLIAAVCLILLAMGLFIAKNILNVRMFKKEIASTERETTALLKKEFPALKTSGSLDAIKKAAQMEVNREKSIWFALTSKNRSSFLIYLQEISTRIDPDGLGLNLARLTLNEDAMTLEGSVKNYEALNKLEEDLRQSKIFLTVPRFEELKFSKSIALNKAQGGRE